MRFYMNDSNVLLFDHNTISSERDGGYNSGDYSYKCLKAAETEASPVISIIMPIFNVEKYLLPALESIFSQQYRDYELICIEDGSSDSSLALLLEFTRSDNRISIYTQTHSGLSAARNLGLQKARGKYIYFFDSDDLMMPNALTIMAENAEKTGAQALYFNGDCFYDEECTEKELSLRLKYQRNCSYPPVTDGKDLFTLFSNNREYFVPVWLAVYRRDFLLEHAITFYPGILFEDILFTYTVLMNADRTGYVDQKVCQRRIRPGSIMTSDLSILKSFSHYTIAMEIMYYWKNNIYCMDAETSSYTITQIEQMLHFSRNEYQKLVEKSSYLRDFTNIRNMIREFSEENLNLFYFIIAEPILQKIRTIPSDDNNRSIINYTNACFSITVKENLITITNNYREIPVQYAWYVYKNGAPVLKQLYNESTEIFQYRFSNPAEYYITAFVRSADDYSVRSSLRCAIINVDSSGIITVQQKD